MQRLAHAFVFPPGPADALDLAKVHVISWRQTYRGLLPTPYLDRMSVTRHARRWSDQLARSSHAEVVMAADGGDGLVGYCAGACLTGRKDSTAEIFTLYLVRTAQGVGLGRSLLASTARVLAARGAESLELWVLNGNHRARQFYDRLGGGVAGERAVRGWGGSLRETLVRWPEIGALCR